ncbi:hypothetical protein CDAR_128671 [Caerostris darwini]|uniref:Uncharacterized protein n=1 Tax=Caerostris darwini TaxID=1538125 RepID=A0AAV4QMK8_9ARAC|nr:hypothetical protein CDAR_128671 [Caerostris darwini]
MHTYYQNLQAKTFNFLRIIHDLPPFHKRGHRFQSNHLQTHPKTNFPLLLSNSEILPKQVQGDHTHPGPALMLAAHISGVKDVKTFPGSTLGAASRNFPGGQDRRKNVTFPGKLRNKIKRNYCFKHPSCKSNDEERHPPPHARHLKLLL